MKIDLHPEFKKSYKKRIAKIPNLIERTAQRIELFQNDHSNPILKDHVLKGKKHNLKAFSITGDIRIIYLQTSEDAVIFLDIGTHNQVY